MTTQIKTADEIAAMREGGKMLATVLNLLSQKLAPGISTKELADIAANELKTLGAQPTFLGYQGFPDVLCVSINNEVVHGIPKPERIVDDGDIVSLDFGVTYKGLITDSAVSLIAGRPQQRRHQEIVANTKKALEIGIAEVHGGVRTGDIGHAIEKFLQSKKYGIVRDLVGHGVGHALHEDPNIPNYGRAGSGPWLEVGMTIAIEPMVTLGSDRVVVAQDGWTVLTMDNSWAAHFEHTVLITQDGAEILTEP
ncbi:MAG TPA: type I methionyl aminopeptidase [Candidatus Saccharimonadales bacterium]|nr:type I methionyl aminopeptidase [Candidatus Saccharimonadales bacterium]